ncbi:MAG: aldehyde dehydrogenase family protein [Saprospiraceae bacterium]
MSAAQQLSPEIKARIDRIFEAQQRNRLVLARTDARARIRKLRSLHDALLRRRGELHAALWADLRKSPTEVDITEIGVVNTEIRHAIRALREWMAPEPAPFSLVMAGSRSYVQYQPKGLALIIAPWNFPVNLLLAPLASAIAAGNAVVLKPSELTPHTAELMQEIVGSLFAEDEAAVVQGEAAVAEYLTSLPFNHIFFTGSPALGKIVMRAAANHLASVTLELGGKSPVIVHRDADLDIAAEKIAWLNGMNAGQICIAPDYVIAHESIADRLAEKVGEKTSRFYGETPEARQASPDLCRMVNERHFERVKRLLDEAVQGGARIVYGGRTDAAQRYIEPTVLIGAPDSARIWEEEIFGPLIPIRTYGDEGETAIRYVNSGPAPLALYVFSRSRQFCDTVIRDTRSGGVAVNDIGVHFYHSAQPFGGINNSGVGRCHGRWGFLEFSNIRSVTRQNRIFPVTKLFHPPYRASWIRNLLIRGVMRWF